MSKLNYKSMRSICFITSTAAKNVAKFRRPAANAKNSAAKWKSSQIQFAYCPNKWLPLMAQGTLKKRAQSNNNKQKRAVGQNCH